MSTKTTTSNVTQLTLETAVYNSIVFSDTFPYFCIKNTTEGNIYVSTNNNFANTDDDVTIIAGGSSAVILNNNKSTLYIKASNTGVINVIGLNSFMMLFSGGSQGGGTGLDGADGKDGSQIYYGTTITGTTATGTIFVDSGVLSANVGDYYMNTNAGNVNEGNMYYCVTAGASDVAEWVYIICLKGNAGTDGEDGVGTETATKTTAGVIKVSDDFTLTGAGSDTLELPKRDKLRNMLVDDKFKSMFIQWNVAYSYDALKVQVNDTYTKLHSTSTGNKQAWDGVTLENGHTYIAMVNARCNSSGTDACRMKINLANSPFTEYGLVTIPISANFGNYGFRYTNNTGTNNYCQFSIQEPTTHALDVDLVYCVLIDITDTDMIDMTYAEIRDRYLNDYDCTYKGYVYFDIQKKLEYALTDIREDEEEVIYPRMNTSRYTKNFWRTNGTKFVDGAGNEVIFRANNVGNDCTNINSIAGSDLIESTNGYSEDHNEDSYRELKELGFNGMRFELNYIFFEGAGNRVIDNTLAGNPSDYNPNAWAWLDREIALARKYDIKLLLNMHVYSGMGGWEIATHNIWTTADSRTRFVNLWKAIATRYKNEDIIIGYGLMNEPVITAQVDNATTIAIYQNLMNLTCTEIRKVDTNHILFVEQALRDTNNDSTLNSNNNFVDVLNNGVPDDKYCWEAHIYHDMSITHEMSASKHLSINYPNEFATFNTGSQYDWVDNTAVFVNIPVDTPNQTEWTTFETVLKIPHANCKLISPFIRIRDAFGGEVWQFCDYKISIYDSNNNFVEDIFIDNAQYGAIFNGGVLGTMTNPQLQGATELGYMQLVSNALSGNTTTVMMNETPASARWRIPAGYKYKISAKYRVQNISSSVIFRFYIGADEINSANVTNTAERFEYYVDTYKTSCDAKNIPLHIGEFGANYKSITQFERGGDLWVRDAFSVLRKKQINYSYFSYSGSDFSMYRGMPKYYLREQKLYDVVHNHFREITNAEIDAIVTETLQS